MAWRVSLQSKSSATDDVVTGFEALNDGGSGVEAGREDVRLLAAFERGSHSSSAWWLGLPRVTEAEPIFTGGIALERGGEVDGAGNGAGDRVDVAAGVNGAQRQSIVSREEHLCDI